METATRVASWRLVPLALGLGVGAHAISHALAPAEPLLAKLGFSPLAYACLTVLPHVGHILTPSMWGYAFAAHPRFALVLAPGLIVFSQLALATGLALLENDHPWFASGMLLFGLMLSSFSRAGISVLQHSCLALVLPPPPRCGANNDDDEPPESPSVFHLRSHAPRFGLLSGLCLMVGITHLIGAITVYVAPIILAAAGLKGLQLALTVPGFIGAGSGAALAYFLPHIPLPRPPPSPTPRRRSTALFITKCPTCGTILKRVVPYQGAKCDKCRERDAIRSRQNWAVMALGTWRAMLIGCLHAFSTLTISLLVSHQLTSRSAGSLVATSNLAALSLLPALAAFSAHPSRMLTIVTIMVCITVICLVTAQELGPSDDASWALAGDKDEADNVLLPPGANPFNDDYFGRHGGQSLFMFPRLPQPHSTHQRSLLSPLNEPRPQPNMRLVHEANAGGPLLQWWLPRIGVIGITFCGMIAPVIPLALVPSVLPPSSEGLSLSRAYGLLDTLSSIGQMLISLTVGATRQAGGYQPALRLLLGGVLLSLPLTVCVQRAIDESSRLTSRAQEPDHQLLIEVEEVQELVPVGVARMDSSIHYGPARASAKLFMVPKRSNSLGY